MKNLKKVLALVTMLTMLLSVAVSAGSLYADVADDASYTPAVEVLNALGIMIGDENGNFNPGNAVTRAEAAAILVRVQGMDDLASSASGSVFTDVPADHWAAGYIQYAYQSGMINGYGDGTYGPSDPVTDEQFVKMIVATLGRTPEAEANGGYPTGYMMVAAQNDITKGVSIGVGEGCPRSDVARLVYNALEVEMMGQKGFGDEISFEENGKTLLNNYLHIDKIEGIVTASVLTEGTTEDDAYVDIDGVPYLVGNTNAVAYLGYAVEAYVAEDEDADDMVIKGITKKSFNSEIVIDYTQFSAFDEATKTLSYFESEKALSDTEVEIAATTGTKFFNGRAGASEVDAFIKALNDGDLAFGTLTLINNDKDDAYEYVMLKQESYNDVVEEANADALTLTGKYSLINAIDVEDENVITSFFKADGTVAEFADIKEGDVLTVYESADGKLLEVYISDAKATGLVEERIPADHDDYSYVIGKVEYRIAYDGADFITSVNVGDEGTFYLNVNGRIVAKEATAAAGTYAYLYKADYIKDIDGAAVQMKVLTSEGKWELLTTAAKVTAVVDGASASSNVFAASGEVTAFAPLFTTNVTDGAYSVTLGDADERLFQYQTDANGYVNKLFIIKNNDGQYDDGVFSLDYNYTDGKAFKASQNKLGNVYFEDETLVFSVPSEGATDEDEITLTKVSTLFQDAETYNVAVYDVVNDVPSIAVAYDAASAIVDGTNLFVVTKVSTTAGENNESLVKLYGYQNGVEVSGTYDVAECDITDRAGADVAEIVAGDVVIFSLDGDDMINNIQVLMSNAEAKAIIAGDKPVIGAGEVVGDDNVADDLFGFVAARKNSRITLATDFDGDIMLDIDDSDIAIALGGSNFTVYEVNLNRTTPTYATSSVAKITANSKVGADGSWVYVRMFDGAIVDVVVYKAENVAPVVPELPAE